MCDPASPGGLIAVIGKREALQPLLSAEFPAASGCVVFSEKIPLYSDLSIRDNVQQLRMMVSERDPALLEALLKRSGLKKQGWTQPFRKDMTGQKRLFGILAAMLTRPKVLLVYDLLVGMEAKQREAFAQMADCCRDGGGTLVYTAQSIRDVLRLELRQAVWLPGGEGFRRTDTAAIAALCAEQASPEQADDLLDRMEAGEAW